VRYHADGGALLEQLTHSGLLRTAVNPADEGAVRPVDCVLLESADITTKASRTTVAVLEASARLTCWGGTVTAGALGELRRFNYERIYTRPESVAQSVTVVKVLQGLVDYFLGHPGELPAEYRTEDAVRGVVTYVGGMTDRFAFDHAERLLGWDRALLPKGIGRGA